MSEAYPAIISGYGYASSFNPSFPGETSAGWISKNHYAIDQGPLVMMVGNYLSGILWRLSRANEYFVRGLRRAGFSGGWLTKIG
jgi:hypothetical protein